MIDPYIYKADIIERYASKMKDNVIVNNDISVKSLSMHEIAEALGH